MDPVTEHALNIGWGMIKEHRAPRLYLWLATTNWEGGWEVSAEPHPQGVAVRIIPWHDLKLQGPEERN